jgi:hypothetical protein
VALPRQPAGIIRSNLSADTGAALGFCGTHDLVLRPHLRLFTAANVGWVGATAWRHRPSLQPRRTCKMPLSRRRYGNEDRQIVTWIATVEHTASQAIHSLRS